MFFFIFVIHFFLFDHHRREVRSRYENDGRWNFIVKVLRLVLLACGRKSPHSLLAAGVDSLRRHCENWLSSRELVIASATPVMREVFDRVERCSTKREGCVLAAPCRGRSAYCGDFPRRRSRRAQDTVSGNVAAEAANNALSPRAFREKEDL